jgi:hypothetical protein
MICYYKIVRNNMKETIELNESLVSKAKRLSGIDNDQELLNMTIIHYIEGAEIREAAQKARAITGNENPFWEGYDPKA